MKAKKKKCESTRFSPARFSLSGKWLNKSIVPPRARIAISVPRTIQLPLSFKVIRDNSRRFSFISVNARGGLLSLGSMCGSALGGG